MHLRSGVLEAAWSTVVLSLTIARVDGGGRVMSGRFGGDKVWGMAFWGAWTGR